MSSGSSWVSKSIRDRAVRAHNKKHPARPCQFGPRIKITKEVKRAVVVSITGYLLLIGCLQRAHFPLNKKYPAIGMLCQGFILLLQLGHADLGVMRLNCALSGSGIPSVME